MINKINPLYILAFFITLCLISYVELSNKKDEISKKNIEFTQFKNEVKSLQTLKTRWGETNSENIINSIRSMSKEIEYKNFRSKVVLTLNSSNTKLQERFVNKILNSNLKIKRFDLKEQIVVFEIGKK